MKVITCASYYGTGSSAITDLISEFDNVCSLTDTEFRFLHDPDGIRDLEYHLIQNHNRHNSGHALKRYKKIVDFYSGNIFTKRYENYFDNQWKKISYTYIAKLTCFTYKGWWQYDLLDRGVFYYERKLFINRILHKLFWRNSEKTYNCLPNEITYCSHPSYYDFIKITKEYVNSLLEVANKDNKDYLMVDQIVASSNISEYTKYFDDIKVVLVERDPRDIYLLAKYKWNSSIVPTDNVELFCKWYRYTRKHRDTEVFDNNVYFIYFEDLIYKYDKSLKELSNFLDLDLKKHLRKKQIFDPDISIKNTRLWDIYVSDKEDIKYIEEQLSQFLYNY